jgi:ubiquinone/menaquinone biosynthesis C-methylase UbiE
MVRSNQAQWTLGFNKVIDIDDFSDSELRQVIRNMYPAAAEEWPDFPVGYEHRKQWEYAMCFRTFLHAGTLNRESRILGVGAGKEDTLYYLTKFVHSVVATDLYVDSESWGDFAPSEMLTNPDEFSPYPDFEPSRLAVQNMDARELLFPDNSFDGVFSLGSIEHFGSWEDIAQAASEMGRVLKPGGTLSLATEYLIDGPEGGTGSDGLRFLGVQELREHIVRPSGLQPIDSFDIEQSARTLSNVYPVMYSFEGGPEGWSFYPHLAFLHPHGYTFCSVHLALRKPTRPTRLGAIRRLLGARRSA